MDGIVYVRLDINLCERLAFIISLTLYLPGYFYTPFVPEGKFAPLSENRLVSDRSKIFLLVEAIFCEIFKIRYFEIVTSPKRR